MFGSSSSQEDQNPGPGWSHSSCRSEDRPADSVHHPHSVWRLHHPYHSSPSEHHHGLHKVLLPGLLLSDQLPFTPTLRSFSSSVHFLPINLSKTSLGACGERGTVCNTYLVRAVYTQDQCGERFLVEGPQWGSEFDCRVGSVLVGCRMLGKVIEINCKRKKLNFRI